MICDLCIRRFDGIWDLDKDKAERLRPLRRWSADRLPSSLEGYDSDCGGGHNNNSNAGQPHGRDDCHDDNTVNNDGQDNHDIAQMNSSSDNDNYLATGYSSNAGLPQGRDDGHDDNAINNDGQYNHDIAQIDSSSDNDSYLVTVSSSSDDESEYGVTRSIHSQTSAAISEKSDVHVNRSHPFRYTFVHHLDLESLMTSVKQGCDICKSLNEIFFHNPPLSQPVPRHLTYFWISLLISRGTLVYHVNFGINPMFERKYLVYRYPRSICTLLPLECEMILQHPRFEYVETVDADDVKADDPDLHVDLEDCTDSTRTWDSVQNWITDCMQSHVNCSNPLGFLPSRLLKLEDDNTFRLVSGEDCAPRALYATLSYCWGPEPAETKFRLLKGNVDTLKEPQLIETLPLTFQHAFTVVKKLGVEYLWIDRLCIMQDSQQDWRREASQMHLVFKNCSFTISAHGAEDDQAGLFYTRDPRQVALNSFTVRLQSPRRYETVALWGERYDKWATEFEGSLAMKRGWIMQERLLSPRTIYYGRNQVFWECNSRRCCEGRPNRAIISQDLSPTDLKPAALPFWRQPLQGAIRGLSDDPLRQLFMDWESVVEEYSSCLLTFIDDKLVALSGLAHDLRAKLLTFGPGLDTYLAGIWMESLPTGLMWMTEGRPYRTYIAPSWSWASTSGKVNFSHKWKYQFRGATETILARVLGGKTTPIGDNDTGQVCGGELTVEGHVIMLNIASTRELRDGEVRVDLTEYCEALEEKFIIARFDDKECRWDQLFCLPIQHNREGNSIHCSVDGLLLELLDDNIMRRVGIFTLEEVSSKWLRKGLLARYSERRSITIV